MKSILKTVAIILALFGISALLFLGYALLVSNYGREAVLMCIGKCVVYTLIGVPALAGAIVTIGLLSGNTIVGE